MTTNFMFSSSFSIDLEQHISIAIFRSYFDSKLPFPISFWLVFLLQISFSFDPQTNNFDSDTCPFSLGSAAAILLPLLFRCCTALFSYTAVASRLRFSSNASPQSLVVLGRFVSEFLILSLLSKSPQYIR